ncbi:MAG: glycerate kinase [Nitrososphaerota archaeon]
MIIKNFNELIENTSREYRKARKIALISLDKAISAVLPKNLIHGKVLRKKNIIIFGKRKYNLNNYSEVIVLGIGKACVEMCEALLEILPDKISRGLLITKHEQVKKIDSRIEVLGAGHPIPDKKGEEAARKLLELAKSVDKNSLTIFLVSGGGSALMPLPKEGITLEDKIETTKLLLKSGATINEMNIVRKHLSAVKGGWIAKNSKSKNLVSLIISDIVGDPIHFIASGPTAPDPTTYEDAINVLNRRNLWDKVPENVRKILLKGKNHEIEETPKPGDKVFRKVYNFIIGSNKDACKAAYNEAIKNGFKSMILTTHLEGEAREVGIVISSIAKDLYKNNFPLKKKSAIIIGGETTVTVKGFGKGGRNQECVLSTTIGLSGLKGIAFASLGTDGIDGITDAAGAITDGENFEKAISKGLNINEFLDNNDSYSFFKEIGDAIHTGPTGTNVGDIAILVYA